jgi:dihydrodipicolinate synthase/N-acetylneuraminate lyase
MTAISSDEIVRDPIAFFPSATVACFDPTCGELPRRALDEGRTIRFLERLGELQVPAVLIAASTGHGHQRTVEELEAWFRCAARAEVRGTVRTALLRPEDGETTNRRLIALLAELRFPIVFVRPGRDLAPTASDAEVAANMRPLVATGADCGLAVGVYSIPDVSGLPLTPAAVAMLSAGPGGNRIVAVKVTEANYETSTLRFLQHPALRHLKIVQGWDPHLARALQDGPRFDEWGRQRCGVTSGPMSFAVHQYLHLLAAARRQDWTEVEASQAAVTALFQAMQDDPGKFADLQRAKYLMGLGQPLTGAVSQQQVAAVLAALERLPRAADRARLARSLDLMEDGPFHDRLTRWSRET